MTILFSKTEKRALAVCIIVLSLLTAAGLFLTRERAEEKPAPLTPAEGRQLQALEQQLKSHADSLYGRGRDGIAAARLFPFDPNHADSLTLLRLGFRPWQASNLMKYRRAGGVWRSPDDLRRLYGLNEEDFARLRPYVRIAPADRRRPRTAYERDFYGTPHGERPVFENVEKYPEGTRLPLNEADTAELKKIPGIGSYYARKIVDYRERLGGFVSAGQVDEVEGLPPGTSRWFTVAPGFRPKQIRLNHATFKQLIRHPYLNYEQTKDIANYIHSYGPLHSWRELRLYRDFTEEDFRRLTPYFSFD